MWEEGEPPYWVCPEWWPDDLFPPTNCLDNLQDLLDLFKHVLPGWDWDKESNVIWLFPPDELKPVHHGHHENPATAFAIAMLRAVGEKE